MNTPIINRYKIISDAGLSLRSGYWLDLLSRFEDQVIKGIQFLDDLTTGGTHLTKGSRLHEAALHDFTKRKWRSRVNRAIMEGRFNMNDPDHCLLVTVFPAFGGYDDVLHLFQKNNQWAYDHGFDQEGVDEESYRLLATVWKYYINIAPAMLSKPVPKYTSKSKFQLMTLGLDMERIHAYNEMRYKYTENGKVVAERIVPDNVNEQIKYILYK